MKTVKILESSEYLRGMRAGLIEAQSAAADLCRESSNAMRLAQEAYRRITARLDMIDLREQETRRMEEEEQ